MNKKCITFLIDTLKQRESSQRCCFFDEYHSELAAGIKT